MQVTFYATLRALVGTKTVEVAIDPGATVRDLAHEIARRWPVVADRVIDEGGGLSRQVHFMLDGRNVCWLPDGAATVLAPGQRIDVFPPAAGG